MNVEDRGRISESLEKALDIGDQLANVVIMDGDQAAGGREPKIKQEIPFLKSSHVQQGDSVALTELDPREFSFNSPHGACEECKGLGTKLTIEPDLVIPNQRLTLAEGAVRPWSKTTSRLSWYSKVLESLGKEFGFSISVAVKDLPKKYLDIVLYGTDGKKIRMPADSRFGGSGYDAPFQGLE